MPLSADSIADAVVCALGSSLPTIKAPSSSASTGGTSAVGVGSGSSAPSSSLWLKTDRAFIIGLGHAPIPAKLVAKIREGYFVELADLLAINLRAVEQEPQTFLEGKLLVSKSKRWQVEITDILTWTEAFTIFQMVMCAAHPLVGFNKV